MKKKSLLFLIVTLILCMCIFPTACDNDIDTEDAVTFSAGLAFELNEEQSGYILIDIGNCSDRKVIIPGFYKGKPVLSIKESAFSNDNYIKSVEMPNSITNVGANAFSNCSSLNSITFSNNIKYIEAGAFYNCNSITKVKIPNSIIEIGDNAFALCVSLSSITIGKDIKSIGENAFYNCPLETVTLPIRAMFNIPKENLKTVIVNAALIIPNEAFSGCVKLESVTFDSGVECIYDAFSNCANLKILYYNGNINDWNSILKATGWEPNNIFYVQCLDGKVRYDEYITIYTGGTGGTYYAFTNGLQTQLSKKTNYTYTVVGDTGGSVANLKAMKNGYCKMAIVQNDIMVNAYNGLSSNFAETGAITNFSVMGEVYPEVIQIVTDDASITSLADLKNSGKSVSIGDIGSGVEASAVALLQKYGIDISFDETAKKYTSTDITIQNLSVVKSVNEMKDDKLDVFFFSSGAPATSITELAFAKNVYMIGLSDTVITEFIADKKIDGKYEVYSKQPITNAQYSFIPVDKTVYTIGVSATYIVSNSLSEEVVYNITKAMWESKGLIGHAVESTMDTAYALVTIGNVPVHPGAAKYYRELGITVENVAEI